MTGINFAQPSSKIILDLINLNNQDDETFSTVSFDTPVPLVTGSVRNTSLGVNSVPGGRSVGSVTVFYNRLDLGVLFSQNKLNVVIANPNTTMDLLPIINHTFGLGLDATDIANVPINGASSITLTALPGSYAYTGSVLAYIIPPPPPVINLASDITLTNLSGFSLTP